MDDHNDLLFTRLVAHITATTGQCVLLLGPELSVNSLNESPREFFGKWADKRKADGVAYAYHDNLFHFTDSLTDVEIPEVVKQFYADVGDKALLSMIARIKFPLIVNCCPDVALNKLMKDVGIDPYCAVFETGKNAAFPEPSKERPVIYNIFGSIEKEFSLICTYPKLYQAIQQLLPENSLPENLQLFLNRAASFLFLGFKFDSWQYQLLCHRLSVQPTAVQQKIAVAVPDIPVDGHISVIMEKAFKIKFTAESPAEFMHRLVVACGEKKDLRDASPHSAYSAFISYAWNNEEDNNRENVVNLIEQRFPSSGASLVKLFRERRDLHYGQSIDAFMSTIGMGKTVILVISDKFLRSRYCMTEAIRVRNYADREKRIFYILLSDAAETLKSLREGRLKKNPYTKFWKDKCNFYLSSNDAGSRSHLKIAHDIYQYIDIFCAKVFKDKHMVIDPADIRLDAESKKYVIDAHAEADFDRFLGDVLGKIGYSAA